MFLTLNFSKVSLYTVQWNIVREVQPNYAATRMYPFKVICIVRQLQNTVN